MRRYDVQATCGMAAALVSVVPALGGVALSIRNYDATLGQIVYGSSGLFLPAFLGCVAASALPAAVGFVLGWNSAGQRRNDKPGRSWVGFFVGGLVLTLDVILLIAFWMLRLEYTA